MTESVLHNLNLDRKGLDKSEIADCLYEWAGHFGMKPQKRRFNPKEKEERHSLAFIEANSIYEFLILLQHICEKEDIAISTEVAKIMYCIKHNIDYTTLTEVDIDELNAGIDACIRANFGDEDEDEE